MSDPDLGIRDEDLHALVDGQLDPARLAEVLSWLQTHPDDAARVAQWQGQRLQLRQLHRSLETDAIPASMTRVVLRERRTAWWQQAVAAVVLLSLGVMGGRLWSATNHANTVAADEPRFVRDAVIAHAVFVPEARHPVEVTASDEAHLVQWLTRRLGAPVKAPVLLDQGFHLLGGRLLPGIEAPRAQFMYEDAKARRLTLYVTVLGKDKTTTPQEAAFRSAHEGSVESFYWVEGRLGYALSASDMPAAEMMGLAREVYLQLMP